MEKSLYLYVCVCIHHSEIVTAVKKKSDSSVGCASFIHVSAILSCYTKNTKHLGEHSVNLPHDKSCPHVFDNN